MEPRRMQVETGLQSPVIRPVASPVDTFIRPPVEDKLDQLSGALAKLSPDIRRFAGTAGSIIDDNAQEAGRQAAEKLRTEGLTLAEATRKGVIPASHNPWYMAGLREQLGRNMADKYDGDLRAAIGSDENLQTSTNISDVDSFTKKFRDQWSKDNIGEGDADQHFNTGFQFRAGAYETQARNSFASGIEEKVKQQGDEATHQEVVGAIQHGIRTGLDLSGDVSDGINTTINDLIKQGRNGATLMRSVALAIHDAAVADPQHADDILKMMETVNGKGGSLSTTSYGMVLTEQAKGKVAAKVQQEYVWNHERAAAQKQATEDGIFQQVNAALEQAGTNAHTVDLRPYREAMNRVSPEHVSTLDQMQDAFVNHEYHEDPHVADDLYVRLHTVTPGQPGYVTVGSIAQAFAAHQISQGTFKSLTESLSKRDQEKNVTADKWFTEGMRRVYNAFASEYGDTQENRLRAESAQTEFAARYIAAFEGKTGPENDTAKNQFISDHIAHEFTDKGTVEERKSFGKIPRPQMSGPARADVSKVMVIDQTTQRALQSELTEKIEGKRSALSPNLTTVLRNYGVKPDNASIQKFVYDQKHMYEQGQRLPAQTPNP